MVDFLSVGTADNLRTLLNGPRFEPHYHEFERDFLIPSLAANSRRGKGPELKHVLTCLAVGEQSGRMKFSSREPPNKSRWQQVDHLALLMFKLHEFNTRNVRGLFYGSSDSDDTIYEKLWYCVKHKRGFLAPSRISQNLGSSSAPAPVTENTSDEEERDSADRQLPQVALNQFGGGIIFQLDIQNDSEGGMTQTFTRTLINISGHYDFQAITDWVTGAFELVNQERRVSRLVRDDPDADGDEIELTRTNWDEFTDHLLHNVKRYGNVVVYVVAALEPGVGDIATTAQLQQAIIHPFDLMRTDSDRFSLWWMLREAGKAATNAVVTQQLELAGAHADMENEAHEQEIYFEEEPRPENQFTEMSEATAAIFKRSEEVTDNRLFQRGDLSYAYRKLGMTHEMDVMEGLLRPLLYWQPCAVAGIVDILDGPISGALLANSVGRKFLRVTAYLHSLMLTWYASWKNGDFLSSHSIRMCIKYPHRFMYTQLIQFASIGIRGSRT